MRRFVIGGMVLAGIVLGASCSNSPTGPSIASVQVAPDSLHLIPGRDTVLVAVALDGAGHAVSGATFTFAASDTTVITVTSAGLVHSKNAGTTTVHVTSGNTIASVPVFVQKPFTITVTPSDTALTQGLAYNVTAVVYDSTLAVIPPGTRDVREREQSGRPNERYRSCQCGRNRGHDVDGELRGRRGTC